MARNYDDRVSRLEQIIDKEKNFDPKKHKDETRAKIAITFIYGFYGALATVFLLGGLANMVIILSDKNTPLADIKGLILTVSSIIGTPLGFVTGYYFKESERD